MFQRLKTGTRGGNDDLVKKISCNFFVQNNFTTVLNMKVGHQLWCSLVCAVKKERKKERVTSSEEGQHQRDQDKKLRATSRAPVNKSTTTTCDFTTIQSVRDEYCRTCTSSRARGTFALLTSSAQRIWRRRRRIQNVFNIRLLQSDGKNSALVILMMILLLDLNFKF